MLKLLNFQIQLKMLDTTLFYHINMYQIKVLMQDRMIKDYMNWCKQTTQRVLIVLSGQHDNKKSKKFKIFKGAPEQISSNRNDSIPLWYYCVAFSFPGFSPNDIDFYLAIPGFLSHKIQSCTRSNLMWFFFQTFVLDRIIYMYLLTYQFYIPTYMFYIQVNFI